MRSPQFPPVVKEDDLSEDLSVAEPDLPETTFPEDEEAAGSLKAQPVEAKKRGQRKSLTSARRELSEKEFASPAVLKLILDDIDRLEDEKLELSSFRDEFHRVDKAVAVLGEKFKTKISIEVLSLGAVTVGAAALGYVPSVWGAGGATPFLILAFGILLVGAGIGAKAVKI